MWNVVCVGLWHSLNGYQYQKMQTNWIETHDGGNFDFDNPGNSTIRITDIATSLSRIPRFNGHSLFHYSVGQHCVLMERALRKLDQQASPLSRLHLLLHDASEAYMGDLCRPLKYMPAMEGFRILESKVQQAIYDRLNIPAPDDVQKKLVKEYDDRMLRTEAEALMTRLQDWRNLILLDPLPVQVMPWTERKVLAAFLSAYNSALVAYRQNMPEK